MKKIIIALILLGVCGAAVYRYNSSPKIILLGLLMKQETIKPGDLQYRINFLNLFPVGGATLLKEKKEEYRGIKVYFLKAYAQTSAYFSKLFSASAELYSYVDAGTGNPVFFKQTMRIRGKADTAKEIAYDQNNGIMTIAGVERTILPETQDPLSLLLKLKKMDLERVREFEMNINTNQKNYVLNANVTPRDIVINQKIFKTYILKAVIKRRDKNNPYHRSKITMIMLKDKENIPISIKVFASGALINVRLIDIK